MKHIGYFHPENAAHFKTISYLLDQQRDGDKRG